MRRGHLGPLPRATWAERGLRAECLRDSLLRGEGPITSHLLYTQPGVLDDQIPEERQMGIDAGLASGRRGRGDGGLRRPRDLARDAVRHRGGRTGRASGLSAGARPEEQHHEGRATDAVRTSQARPRALRQHVRVHGRVRVSARRQRRRRRLQAPNALPSAARQHTVVRFDYDAPDGSRVDAWDTDLGTPGDFAAAVAVDIQHRAIARVRISVSDGEVGSASRPLRSGAVRDRRGGPNDGPPSPHQGPRQPGGQRVATVTTSAGASA